MDYKDLCIDETMTVRDAMEKINESGFKILFIVKENKVLAALTDGDIRRFLLGGGNIDATVVSAGNQDLKTARNVSEAKMLYDSQNCIAIPIIGSQDQLVDIYYGNLKQGNRNSSLDIPVVINAGGKGTRLDPFTRVLPKPLIPVGDMPIIEHIMQLYQQHGCKKYHIIVNYKKQLMKAYFNENENDYEISWYDEEKPLGTGGGLSLLREELKETFFFTNCDILLQSDYEKMLCFHRENKNLVTMVCARKNMTIPYGVVEIGENGKILEFREKPELSFLTNTGMYIVEPEVLNDIADGVPVGFPDVIENLRKKGKNVAVYPVDEDEWMDMGQLDELEKMRKRLYGE